MLNNGNSPEVACAEKNVPTANRLPNDMFSGRKYHGPSGAKNMAQMSLDWAFMTDVFRTSSVIMITFIILWSRCVLILDTLYVFPRTKFKSECSLCFCKIDWSSSLVDKYGLVSV